MKYSIIVFILTLLKCIILLGQDIEIPESIITGQDRNIYKTPIFLYPHEIQIKFPEAPEMPEEFPKIKKQIKQPEQTEKIKKTGFQEFTVATGKSGYFLASVELNHPQTFFTLSAIHDDSFRRNDSKDLIKIQAKKSFDENLEFSFDFWNCIKEIPLPAIVPPNRKKHTNMVDIEFSYNEPDYSINLVGIKNSLNKLEEKGGFFIFDKSFGNFSLRTEFGFDKFADKNNELFCISTSYKINFLKTSLGVKSFGGRVRILPSATFETKSNGINFSTTLSSNFSSPQLWKQVAQQPYLEMKNKFLQPEEIYSIDVEFSGEKSGIYFSMKNNLSYERVGYHWLDLDGNNLYEPAVLKDNFVNSTSLTFGKEFKKFFIESNYSFLNMSKKKSGFPESSGYLIAGFNAGKFKPNFQLTYMGDQEFNGTELKGYIILSASILYWLKLETMEMTLFSSLNNIVGKNYQIAPGYPGEPFNFIAGFQLRW